MSMQEREELDALLEWLQTFPQIEQTLATKENRGHDTLLQDPDLSRYASGLVEQQ